MVSLKGKVALITGASRGIGKAISKALAQEGVNLAINSRAEESLLILKNELSIYNIDILICPFDLRDPKAPKILIEKVVEHFGGLDILINNAGIALAKSIMDTTEEEWDEIMAVNARAPFFLSKYAIPYLKKSDIPTIINISSVVGTKGYVNQGAYTASKHALMGFTKVLAQEVHEDGIRVHVISPGGVATDLVTIMRPDLDPSTLIKPEEIAEVVLFLLKHRGNAVIDEINIRRAQNPPWR
ncbi:MAG: 3-oxoacyl-ACP reductase [Dictyoglomus sp. NZ13-RE01]|nr:MAG: 3-oxoacyl-ACP reductase [Dictyoglomus sp. NZ13-RE01]